MHFGDRSQLGWLPGQHHDPEYEVDMRNVLSMVRQIGWDDDGKPLLDLAGDVSGAAAWRAGSRKANTWFLTGAPVVNTQGGTPPGNPVTTTKASVGAWALLQAADTPDVRLETKSPALPGWFRGAFPKGHTGQASAGTEEKSQQDLLHPDYLGLYAPQANGAFEAGSTVYDFRADGSPDPSRFAWLQQLVRVADLGQTGFCGFSGLTLAIQNDKDDLKQKSGGFPIAEGKATALTSWLAGGPLRVGKGLCQHAKPGPDGPIHPTHLDVNSLFLGLERDGPLRFQTGEFEPTSPEGPFRYEAHLLWDGTYPQVGKCPGTGVWRWQVRLPFTVDEPPRQPPPPYDPKQPPPEQPPPYNPPTGDPLGDPQDRDGTGVITTDEVDPTDGVGLLDQFERDLQDLIDSGGVGELEDTTGAVIDQFENDLQDFIDRNRPDDTTDVLQGGAGSDAIPYVGDGTRQTQVKTPYTWTLPSIDFKPTAQTQGQVESYGDLSNWCDRSPHVASLSAIGVVSNGSIEDMTRTDGTDYTHPTGPGVLLVHPSDVRTDAILRGESSSYTASLGFPTGMSEINMGTYSGQDTKPGSGFRLDVDSGVPRFRMTDSAGATTGTVTGRTDGGWNAAAYQVANKAAGNPFSVGQLGVWVDDGTDHDDGDLVYYDGSGTTVISAAGASAMDDLSDADTSSTSPATGDALQWTGSLWEPSSAGASSGPTFTISDAATVTAPTVLSVNHETSSTPSTNFGSAIGFNAQATYGPSSGELASIAGVWSEAPARYASALHFNVQGPTTSSTMSRGMEIDGKTRTISPAGTTGGNQFRFAIRDDLGAHTAVPSGETALTATSSGVFAQRGSASKQQFAMIDGTAPSNLNEVTAVDENGDLTARDVGVIQLTSSGGSFAVSHNETTLSGSGATLVASNLIPAGANLLDLHCVVSVADGGGGSATGFNAGDGSDADRYGVASALTLNTNLTRADFTVAGEELGKLYSSAGSVTLTAVGGTFDTISVNVTAFYTTPTVASF